MREVLFFGVCRGAGPQLRTNGVGRHNPPVEIKAYKSAETNRRKEKKGKGLGERVCFLCAVHMALDLQGLAFMLPSANLRHVVHAQSLALSQP